MHLPFLFSLFCFCNAFLFTFLFFLPANRSSLISSAFSHLLDDNPLPLDEVSASELMVSFSHGHPQSSQAPMVGLRSSMAEVDRGFVTLVASDHPGIEV